MGVNASHCYFRTHPPAAWCVPVSRPPIHLFSLAKLNLLWHCTTMSKYTSQSSYSSDQSTSQESRPATGFRWHHDEFDQVLGAQPQFELLVSSDTPFAHEAGVYFESEDELFVTSNRMANYGCKGTQKVQISRIDLSPVRRMGSELATREEIASGPIHMGNGGANYQGGILFCAQGSDASPSGLIWMSRVAPFRTKPLITSYHGVPFNSVNDVVVSKTDGSIWFTDPAYGYEQGYKAPPRLPSQVYRYTPSESGSGRDSIRAVADGFGHPNGLCFSSDESILYVTDTDKVHGSGDMRNDRPSSM